MPDAWITTKGGDKGETSLGDGSRVPKDHPRVEGYGTLDECQAAVGSRGRCASTRKYANSSVFWSAIWGF